MLKMICKLILLGVLVVLVKAGLLLATRRYDIDYMAVSAMKQARLHEPGRNRIVFVGGSNVAFGIDSKSLEACTGRRVVNLGLHAGLGLEYMLKEAANGARRGDVVVLSPEYEHFCGLNPAGEGPALLWLVQFNPAAARYLTDFRQWLNIAQSAAVINNRQWVHSMIIRIAQRTYGSTMGVYSSSSFNDAGDVVGHLDLPTPPKVIVPTLGVLDPQAVKQVDHFCTQMSANGLDCLFVYPSVSRSYWTVNRATMDRVAAHMSRWQAPTTPEDWVYPDSDFYDTTYHPNRTGRELRTQRLCGILTRWLAVREAKP